MIIDDEARAGLRKKLSALVASQTDAALRGSYPDLAAFERQRGVLVGLGMALDLLEDSQPTEPPRAEEQENDQTTD